MTPPVEADVEVPASEQHALARRETPIEPDVEVSKQYALVQRDRAALVAHDREVRLATLRGNIPACVAKDMRPALERAVEALRRLDGTAEAYQREDSQKAAHTARLTEAGADLVRHGGGVCLRLGCEQPAKRGQPFCSLACQKAEAKAYERRLARLAERTQEHRDYVTRRRKDVERGIQHAAASALVTRFNRHQLQRRRNRHEALLLRLDGRIERTAHRLATLVSCLIYMITI